MSIEEGETWDAARIFKQFWEKGVYECSAKDVRKLFESLNTEIQEKTKRIKEDERSETFRVRANVPRLKEELEDLKQKQRIVKKRLEYFAEQQKKLSGAYKQAETLNQQGIEILDQIRKQVGHLKDLVERHRALRGEFERLRHKWEFVNWDPAKKSPEASQLTLQDPKEVTQRKLAEIISSHS